MSGTLKMIIVMLLSAGMNLSLAPGACDSEEARQFDFWIGDWDLVSQSKDPNNPDQVIEQKMSNRIEATLDGCVIVESFSGQDSLPLRGTSISLFDKRIGKWRQTWADNNGGWFGLAGEFEDGRMVLETPERVVRGKKTIYRMVFSDITPDSLLWEWSRSADGGATWSSGWKIHYKRK